MHTDLGMLGEHRKMLVVACLMQQLQLLVHQFAATSASLLNMARHLQEWPCLAYTQVQLLRPHTIHCKGFHKRDASITVRILTSGM